MHISKNNYFALINGAKQGISLRLLLENTCKNRVSHNTCDKFWLFHDGYSKIHAGETTAVFLS